MEVLDIVTILGVGMLIGVEFSVSAFVNPILGSLEGGIGAEAARVFARVLGRVMPFWYIGCFAALTAETVLRFRAGGFAPLVLACGLWASVVLLSVLVLAPINNRLIRMSPAESQGELQEQHVKWDRIHRGRVLLLAVAMVCLLHAISS
ncbi:MAG TPA: DUF1772 domain-containing protein [Acidobacteriaceae bacterium]